MPGLAHVTVVLTIMVRVVVGIRGGMWRLWFPVLAEQEYGASCARDASGVCLTFVIVVIAVVVAVNVVIVVVLAVPVSITLPHLTTVAIFLPLSRTPFFSLVYVSPLLLITAPAVQPQCL